MMTVDELTELAKETAFVDNINWGEFLIDRDSAYKLIATSVLEQFENTSREAMLIAVTHLVVENFVLNYQLALLQSRG